MKTFDEKAVITWSNRNQAKVGKKYYFANSISELQSAIAKNRFSILKVINNNAVDHPFLIDDNCFVYDYYACILEV